jgi:hypothetical protein
MIGEIGQIVMAIGGAIVGIVIVCWPVTNKPDGSRHKPDNYRL